MKERPILFSAPMVRAILDGTKTQTRRLAKNPFFYKPPRSPYGKEGDRLWVRETFYAFGRWETRYSARKCRDEWHFVDMTMEWGPEYDYAADGRSIAPYVRTGGVNPCWWKRPAIFMPRAASRITLEITNVHVQRLQDISEADASAEGALCELAEIDSVRLGAMASHRGGFRNLWTSINGHDSWDANPWVWVIEFRRIS